MCMAVFQLAALVSYSQSTIKVTGKVTDSNGESLPAVSIKVKGSTTGITSSMDGTFSINVPSQESVLVFTYVGFLTKEQVVGSRTTLNVVLEENVTDLEEVVVIGYGQKVKKRDLTGAISSINSKDIEERQPINLFDALQGQAAGVLIINDGGGAPGATGSIQIRGASTLNGGNGPLYVVDGVIDANGAFLNPSDIESIEVLKDAASSSIYGARAANGVILITTKRGKEGKPRLDAQYSHVFGKLAKRLPQNNSAQVREFRNIQGNSSSVDSLNPSFNADNDLQDLLMGNTAHRTEVKLGISGGQKNLKYYSGLNFLDDKSIILNSWAKRVQSRINIEYQATEKLKYSNNISFYWQKANQIPIANTVRVALDRPAYSLIYYPDGSLTSYIASKRNPVANALYEKDIDETYSGQFNNQLEYQFYKDLKFTTLFNAKLDNFTNSYFSPRFLSPAKDKNAGRNETTKNFTWEYQAFFNYSKIITDHNISGMIGFSADKRRFDRLHTEYENSVNEEIQVTLPDYLIALNTYTDATANATASLFGRLGYSYKSRYIVQGTVRRDGSSRFGKDKRWGNFFSASAAWRFSDEKFMNWSDSFLDDAKLRFGVGQLGNDRIGDYESYTKVTFGGNYNNIGGAYLNPTFGNNQIQWEKTTDKNVAIDLSLFKGKIGFSADYYVKTTSDLLYRRELPKETGFNDVSINVGSLQTKGIEFVVSAAPVTSKKFSWKVNGNISFERGKILELDGGIPFFEGNKWFVEQGGRIGNFYGWKNLGVYQWDESNAYNDNWEKLTVVTGADGKPLYENGKPKYTYNGQTYTGTIHNLYAPDGKLRGGDSEWLNLERDSLIDDADRHVIGNGTPDFYFGLINTLSYKKFSFTFMFNGSFGADIYNALQQRYNYPSNTGAGSPDMVQNVWRKPGDIAKYPYYIVRNNRGNLKSNQNSLYIENGSFIRLASARLSYSLDQKLASKLYMKGLTAYIYGTNLVTWTNYTGYDPEFSTSNPLRPGEDDGRYPKRRELGLGINVNF